MEKNSPATQARLTSPVRYSWLQRLVGSQLFWAVFLLSFASIPIWRTVFRDPHKLPPVLNSLRSFELTNQNGDKVTLEALQGKVLVVNFIYTSCQDVCPLLTQQMAKIQRQMRNIAPGVQLLSISVDPEADTPSTLKDYAQKYHADPLLWQFLTGKEADVRKIVTENFKLPMSKESTGSLIDVAHGEYFVVVDQLARVRGYRTANNSKELEAIIKDVNLLVLTDPHQVSTSIVR